MNKKIIIPIAVVVIVIAAFAGYTLTKSKHTTKLKIDGITYVLPKQFTINMAGGQYATLTVALVLVPGESVGTTSATNPPPTGFGTLLEEPEIRAIITNDVTNQPTSVLLTTKGRTALEAKIVSDINAQTDTKISRVLFTDLAVQ